MGIAESDLSDVASSSGTTILMKGSMDTIVDSDGTVHEVSGGNAGLTTGGTGDVLAGTIAGLIAQGESHISACTRASNVIKKSGELLFKDLGYAYTAADVIERIPHLLSND